MEIIRLGKTSLPQDVIAEYLDSLKKIYTREVIPRLKSEKSNSDELTKS